MMKEIKINIHGRLYFVPKTHMQYVSLFEDFIEALNQYNQNTVPLDVNSTYVMDDEKQRQYEGILQQELNELNDEFSMLQIRSRKI